MLLIHLNRIYTMVVICVILDSEILLTFSIFQPFKGLPSDDRLRFMLWYMCVRCVQQYFMLEDTNESIYHEELVLFTGSHLADFLFTCVQICFCYTNVFLIIWYFHAYSYLICRKYDRFDGKTINRSAFRAIQQKFSMKVLYPSS